MVPARVSRFRAMSPGPALLCLLIVACLAATVPAAEVGLAGTFNNWNAGDPAHRMKLVGSRLELVKIWRAGAHEFKFTYDGSWDRHLGEGDHGALVQPGRNIQLTIPTTGCWAVWLDETARRWGIERRPSPEPIALVRVRGADIGAARVELDGSGSIARDGHPIQTFTWQVAPLGDRGRHGAAVADSRAARTDLTVDVPGRYEISLTVSDGQMQSSESATAQLGFGWKCRVAPAFGDAGGNAVTPIPTLPMGGDDWGAVIALPAAGRVRVEFRPVIAAAAGGDVVSTEIDARGPGRYLACLRAAPRTIEVFDSGWHEFVYDPDSDPRPGEARLVERVELVGDFNDWQTGRTPLYDCGGRLGFRRILSLPDGLHHYKLVINGLTRIEDPSADAGLRAPDGRGGFNSGVRVGDDPASLGGPRPNEIVAAGLRHDPRRPEYFRTIGTNVAYVSLRSLAGDLSSAAVRLEPGGSLISMTRGPARQGFDYWTASLLAPAWPFQYVFEVADGEHAALFDREGLKTEMGKKQAFEGGGRPSFATPDWAKTAVWYQIFPERFRNGERSNDPPSSVPWQHEWFKPYQPRKGHPDGSRAFASGYREKGRFYEYIYDRRYGGDLQGVREKLPYLRSLGITAIYLNPVFQAPSLHKYDAADFRHIDDSLVIADSRLRLKGETEDPRTWQWSESDRWFLEFLKEAHAMGFRVILDGVFNHVGKEFWAFQDVMKHGEASRYVDWFDITSFKPFHYKGWDRDDGELPRLKHDDARGLSEPVRQHIFEITKRWMDPNGDGDPSDGIDGWRLDVASDINAHFWRDWRKLVKSINPDAYIVAELWEESKVWLQGDCFDAVMNYEFARRVQRFIVNRQKATRPSEFGNELATMLSWYEPQVNYVLQNLFDSHDTDRIASMCMNPDLEYDKANRLQDNGPKYNPAKPTPDCYERVKLAVTFQMTFLGAPMVWYGNEVGMYGADDPSCRKPMLWEDLLPYDDADERIHEDVRQHHRRLIAIRNSEPALQLGTYEQIAADDATGVFAFARTLGNDTIVVVLNNSDRAHKPRVSVPWKNGARVIRLDDPAACEVVEPPPLDPTARPRVKPVPWFETPLHVQDGRLMGVTLAPRSGGVYKRVGG